ncbi:MULTISPECIES: hypothetical protein [Sphingobacterium]|uniref:hypothetical protein n=1 Tax=Sphingobacterium TaxID=28453 RepID=UPI00104A7418|nr:MULTISPECIES: hypothetical protein [Sphingobacterium]MCW2261030.1 hypothetical protein [Sphingobacterium kitahiroshimense]
MKRSEIKARQILAELKNGNTVEQVISHNQFNAFEWNNLSKAAYNIELEEEIIKRRTLFEKKIVLLTSNDEIEKIISLNSNLSSYALALHPFATKNDLNVIFEWECNSNCVIG